MNMEPYSDDYFDALTAAQVFCCAEEWADGHSERLKKMLKPCHVGTKVYATDARAAVEIETGMSADEGMDRFDVDKDALSDPEAAWVSLVRTEFDNAEKEVAAGERDELPLAHARDAVRETMLDKIKFRDLFFGGTKTWDILGYGYGLAVLRGGRVPIIVDAELLRRVLTLEGLPQKIHCYAPREQKSVYFTGDGWRAVVMPMRTEGSWALTGGAVADVATGLLLHSYGDQSQYELVREEGEA